MADKHAVLTNQGKLIVDDSTMVEKLNSEMLGGKTKDGFLKADEDSTLEFGKTLTAEGSIDIKGSLKLGSAVIAPTDTGISIGF